MGIGQFVGVLERLAQAWVMKADLLRYHSAFDRAERSLLGCGGMVSRGTLGHSIQENSLSVQKGLFIVGGMVTE